MTFLQRTKAYAKQVAAYCKAVLTGKIPAGRYLIAAVQRFLDDAKRLKHKFVHNAKLATRAILFIESLTFSTGEFENQPFILQPWQKFIVWNLFGWVDVKTGLRRFREAYISLGRGNGKSPLAAALLLFLLCADQPAEARAQIKIAATERGIDGGGAMIVFNEMVNFIERSNELRARCSVRKMEIVYTPNASNVAPLGKEAKTKDGFNLHAYVADELHEWAKEQQPLWDKLETAMGKRRQPLAISITTAGSDRSFLWKTKYFEACKVLKGVQTDEALFVFLCQIDEPEPENDLPGDDLWTMTEAQAMRALAKANPNIGISVKTDYLARMWAKAKENPAVKAKLLRYHANVLVRSRQKIIPLDKLKACLQPLPDLLGKPCHGGLDLGWRDDLAAFYLVFPLPDRKFAVRGWCWTCEDNPHRNLWEEPWASWIDQGRLLVSPGEVNDPEAILAQIKRAKKQYRIASIALDMNNAHSMEVALTNQLGLEIYAFGQSPKKYNEPLREWITLILEGRLVFDDPLLLWSFSNMVTRQDAAGLLMPDKSHSDEKIDPAVATLMGFSECLYSEKNGKAAGYTERGLRKLT